MSLKNSVSRGTRIVDDYMQKNPAKAFVFDWNEVISELHESGREGHAKQSLTYCLQNVLELSGMRKTLQDVFARNRSMYKTSNKS